MWSRAAPSGSGINNIASHTYIGQSTNNATSVTTDVVGQDMTIGSANVVITAISDATTISSIKLPSATQTQLGKWKVEAQVKNVTVKMLTLQVRDDSYVDDVCREFLVRSPSMMRRT